MERNYLAQRQWQSEARDYETVAVQGAVRAHEIDIQKIADMLTRCQRERDVGRHSQGGVPKWCQLYRALQPKSLRVSARDPALAFPKCCLREPCGRARSHDDDRKLHVKADGALHKGCAQMLMQVLPLS